MVAAAPMSRDEFLAAPLGRLIDWWLRLHCGEGCSKVVCFPLKLMAARNGVRLKLGAALNRLRCEHCGAAPASAALTDHPNDSDQGGLRSSWKIELVP
jgi:hypothetical protein